jgi:hypothetical protein
MRFSGFDDLQRHLRELNDALSSMNGFLGNIQIRSTNPDDVNQAIAEMEAAVDARVGSNASNAAVRQIIAAMKEKYAAGIRQRANELAQTQHHAVPSAEDEFLSNEDTQADLSGSAPKAFISHSHADKESIVRPLDKLLREVEGIKVWLDERDMPAGADIVDAIFSKGIGEADAVIVVLTPSSINSRWVHEELNVSVVRKIKKRVKAIIPVVYGISDDDVPDALVATNWIRLADTSETELADCARRIGAALHGIVPAPVAPPPPYAGIPIHRLPSLRPNDERLFAEACRQYLERDYYHPAVDVQSMITYGDSIGMTSEQVVESLHALEQHHYIGDLQFYLGSGNMPNHFRISDYGLESYLRTYKADEYAGVKNAVISEIVKRNGHDLSMICRATGVSESLARHIVRNIERGGQARVSWHSGGASVMAEPTLKRLLEGP